MDRTHIPLLHVVQPKKSRKPIRRVSRKRAKQNAEYKKRRDLFLTAHPFCQVWLKEHGFTEDQVEYGTSTVGYLDTNGTRWYVPYATEVHHMRHPKSTYLNDESTWLACSRQAHSRIHANPKWARDHGFLMDNH